MSVYAITRREYIVESEGYREPPPLRWEPAKGERLVGAHVEQFVDTGRARAFWRWTLIVEAISA